MNRMIHSNNGPFKSAEYVIHPATASRVKVAGHDQDVSRYGASGASCAIILEHIQGDGPWKERDPPFFFASRRRDRDDGGTVPYPPLPTICNHEVEMVVALKSGGRNIAKDKAPRCVWATASASISRAATCRSPRATSSAWEIGKAFDALAVRAASSRALEIGNPAKGRICSFNGEVKQDAISNKYLDLAGNHLEALRDGRAAARRHHHAGTPRGRQRVTARHKIECEVEGVGKVSVTIGEKA